MSVRSFIVRLAQTGRSLLTRRRIFPNIQKDTKIDETDKICKLKPASKNLDGVLMCNIDRARVHNELCKVVEAKEDDETIRCDEFADEDTINAVKFADECTATSYRFADEDTINAGKLVDEDSIACAKFATDEISKVKERDMEFVRVVRSGRASTWTRDYQIILEALDNETGEKNLYYAQVQPDYMDDKSFKLVYWMSG